jgi:hypothetical protein
MKLHASLTAFVLLPVLALADSKQEKENKEQLTQVSRIYVAGDGPTIEKVRDRIGRAKSCFVLSETSNGSDAILYVATPDEPRMMSFQPSESVQGELKKGDSTIWSTESSLPTSSNRGAAVGLAIVSLVNSLERDAGCGKKKGALAQGQGATK